MVRVIACGVCKNCDWSACARSYKLPVLVEIADSVDVSGEDIDEGEERLSNVMLFTNTHPAKPTSAANPLPPVDERR